jgi:predicted RNA methylase
VLDLGCGTGRFALPMARLVEYIESSPNDPQLLFDGLTLTIGFKN